MHSTQRIRVLVVDDSVLYRKVVRDVLKQHPQVEIIGVATNGEVALEKIALLRPDLITLDIEMPGMDGLGVLRELRDKSIPTKAIMLSSQTGQGALSTMNALQLGAFDFVLKPAEHDYQTSKTALAQKLLPCIDAYLSKHITVPIHEESANAFAAAAAFYSEPIVEDFGYVESSDELELRDPIEAVAIGISTGGPMALTLELPKIPSNFPVPIFIVQHMPPLFTKSLSDDLNRLCKLKVVEGYDGAIVQPGTVYIAPGGKQMAVIQNGTSIEIQVNEDPPERNCRPSVDYLFRSVATVYGKNSLAVAMTGMGDDGTAGARLLSSTGVKVIAQDEPSSTVFGMPRSIIHNNLADLVSPLTNIAAEISSCVNKSRRIG
ncbi:MAG: protein-glutamate methylesterase/protein-glutamine glutaminase [Pirellulales bacterium]|jgi:two-component system chemotaxis response regulator CheB